MNHSDTLLLEAAYQRICENQTADFLYDRYRDHLNDKKARLAVVKAFAKDWMRVTNQNAVKAALELKDPSFMGLIMQTAQKNQQDPDIQKILFSLRNIHAMQDSRMNRFDRADQFGDAAEEVY